MAMTDQCPHGALLGACLYCSIGSKNPGDLQRILETHLIFDKVKRDKQKEDSAELARKQNAVLITAANLMFEYIVSQDLQNNCECPDCKKMIDIIGRAIYQCVKLNEPKN